MSPVTTPSPRNGSGPITVRPAVPLSARLADPVPLGLSDLA